MIVLWRWPQPRAAVQNSSPAARAAVFFNTVRVRSASNRGRLIGRFYSLVNQPLYYCCHHVRPSTYTAVDTWSSNSNMPTYGQELRMNVRFLCTHNKSLRHVQVYQGMCLYKCTWCQRSTNELTNKGAMV